MLRISLPSYLNEEEKESWTGQRAYLVEFHAWFSPLFIVSRRFRSLPSVYRFSLSLFNKKSFDPSGPRLAYFSANLDYNAGDDVSQDIYIFDPLSWREIDKSGFSSKKGVDIFDLGRSMEKESWLVFSLTIPKSLRPPWFKRNAGRRERSGGEECVRHRPFAYVTNPSNRSDLWTLLSPIDP